MNTILVIDDDDQLRRSFEKLLTGEGYQVISAASAEAGLQALRQRGARADQLEDQRRERLLGQVQGALAGVVLGSSEAIKPIREAVGVLGGVLDANSAYLLLRGLKTLALRMNRHNETALRVATWLEAHPAIRRVWYPGLASHPDHAIAAKLMDGFGGVVTFEIETDLEGAIRFIDATRIPYQAPSLGGVETLIELPVTMSFWATRYCLPPVLITAYIGRSVTRNLCAKT